MAQPLPPQIPQHVSALLSHLTSRPGVQSTLILSRKDGSIIQSTGLLAASSTSLGAGNITNTDNSTIVSDNAATSGAVSSPTDFASVSVPPTSSHQESPLPTLNASVSGHTQNTTQNNQQPYKPSQAETLAAHIHAFMSSASGLALSLSGGSSSTGNEDIGFATRSSRVNGTEDGGPTNENFLNETADRAFDREEDDEIKLVRLRTKKNEIVVVPDRRYLLCVVHDASGAAATTSSSGGSGMSR